MHPAYAFFFALIAAIGNGLFVDGWRRSEDVSNPALFMLLAMLVCASLFMLTMTFFPKVQLLSFIEKNDVWVLISGVGYYLTFIGFYYLFTHFGASYYALYAVLSIITTTVIVGFLVFREAFNLYYGLAVLTAMLTVVFFAIGQQR